MLKQITGNTLVTSNIIHVKHGRVRYVKDWLHSSFHRYVNRGTYAENWETDIDVSLMDARE